MSSQLKNSLLLTLGAMIWGFGFVAQSAGSELGPFTFLAGRSWLAVIALFIAVRFFDALHARQGQPTGKPKTKAERRTLYIGGAVCGTFLFMASAAQQIGITLNASTAKAGFLTAMYVVLVPVFGLFLGRSAGSRLWLCIAMAVAGLYLLCMKDGFGRLAASDWWLLACAALFSFQIMAIGHYSPLVDGVRLSLLAFFVTASESTVTSFLLETPTIAGLKANAAAIAYCGLMSSGVGYTLQILCQKKLNPTVASLIMCLESVFSAIGGWLLLHQTLTARESLGCCLLFAAVVLSQLPVDELIKKRKNA